MASALAADEATFRAEVREWLAAELKPFLARYPVGMPTHNQEVRRAWEDHICRAGWGGLSWPKEQGGKELPDGHQAIFHEEYARAGAPLPLNSVAHGILGPTLILYGTDAQKRRYLPKILSNEEIWCQGYSEPGAGSDLASLQSRAQREGDHFLLRGHKIWTSFAHLAQWCFVLARTDMEAPKHRGISFLLVDMKSPGITVRPIRQITGEADFNEVLFDNVTVPLDNLVGVENQGWQIAMAAASFERGTYFLPRLVRIEIELADLAKLAGKRDRNGAAPIDDPLIQERLALSYIDVHVLRLHAYRALEVSMKGHAPGPESSYIKLLWSESHQRLLDLAIDILGRRAALGPQEPSSVEGEHWWQRDFLWTRAETILAGTSEIQRNIIAERVLGLPR